MNYPYYRVLIKLKLLMQVCILSWITLLCGCIGQGYFHPKENAILASYRSFCVRAPISANGVLPTTQMHVFSDLVVQMINKGYVFNQEYSDIIIAPLWWVNIRAQTSVFNSTAVNNAEAIPLMNTSASLEIDALDSHTHKVIWKSVQKYDLVAGNFNKNHVKKAVKDVMDAYPNAIGVQPIIPVALIFDDSYEAIASTSP